MNALSDFFRRPGFSITLRCSNCAGRLSGGGRFGSQYRA